MRYIDHIAAQSIPKQDSSGIMYPSFPLGVSNAFTGKPARVSVAGGALVLVWEDPGADAGKIKLVK